ncbi:MAG: response regulator transcription factor [Microvirga sp.]
MTRILIADDHDVVRAGLRAILQSQAGWEVVAEASDGKEAVELALATRPDVAVSIWPSDAQRRRGDAADPLQAFESRNPDLHDARYGCPRQGASARSLEAGRRSSISPPAPSSSNSPVNALQLARFRRRRTPGAVALADAGHQLVSTDRMPVVLEAGGLRALAVRRSRFPSCLSRPSE